MSQPNSTTIAVTSLPNRQAGHVHPNDGHRDQFLLLLELIEFLEPTDAFELLRANSIPSVPFVENSANKNLPAMNVDLISFAYQRISEHVQLDSYWAINGRKADNLEIQARGVKWGILRQLSLQLIEGTIGPNILGLRSLSALNTTGAAGNNPNGGFMTLQDLYRAIYNVKPTDDFVGGGAADVAVLNPKALRELFGLINATGTSNGLTWEYIPKLNAYVPRYLGILWLFSDSVPLTETKGTGTNLTSIYFLKMSGPTGLKLGYGRDKNMKDVDEWGLHTYEIPMSAAQNVRGLAIEGFYTLIAPERLIVSRLNGINPTQYAL